MAAAAATPDLVATPARLARAAAAAQPVWGARRVVTRAVAARGRQAQAGRRVLPPERVAAAARRVARQAPRAAAQRALQAAQRALQAARRALQAARQAPQAPRGQQLARRARLAWRAEAAQRCPRTSCSNP